MDEDMRNEGLENGSVDNIETSPETILDAVSEVPEIQDATEIQEAAVQTVSGTEPVTSPAPVKGKKKKTTGGGQALIEGSMMCGPHRTAIAVRKADGSIYVEEIKKSASETAILIAPGT